jgi:DHA2 family multidrug resistance protein
MLMATAALPAAARASVPHRGLITASVILATVLQVLDTTIANVALPHMQAALGANRETITWVLTSYIVAAAIATPITGWLSDRVGQKRLFLIAIVGFVVASMACGAATSLPMMVAVRAIQGIFGAFLVPLSQTILLDAYPREKHGQAMALWGAAVMASPVLGPVLGGWLTDNFSWRWVFYVNLPVGVAALAGAWISLPKLATVRRRFDLFGFALLGLALAGLQLMLDRGPHLDWFESPEILIETGVAIAALWILAVHLATSRNRIFDPAMLADRNYLAALAFAFIAGLVMTAGAALLPPMLQQLYGYPTIEAGMLMAPRGAGTVVAFVITGRFSGKIDPRFVILTGFCLIALSLYQMTGFSLEMGQRLITISGFIQGAGMGFAMGPLLTLGFATLSPRFRTDASSLFSLLRGLGGSIGVAIVTAVLAHNVQVSHSDLATHITAQAVPGAGLLAAGGGGSVGMAAAMVDGEINRQALMIAYLDDYHMMMLLTLCAVPLLLFVRRPPKQAPGAGHAVME